MWKRTEDEAEGGSVARIPLGMMAAGILAAACAGNPPPAPPPPAPALCEIERRPGADAPDAATWLSFLLRGLDPVSKRATVPALDCTGAQVRWDDPALSCQDGAFARTALSGGPLSAHDVLTTPVSQTETLVWITTTRFASGDAFGPVALVETAGPRLRVLAVGPLLAYPQHARLRLERLGDRRVLVAEGELCGSADVATCQRAARIVLLRGDRFVPEPLVGDGGQCVSPAWFELVRREQRRAGSRWERVELIASLAFNPGGLTIDEQVVVQDLGTNSGGAPARVVHRARSRRTVRWANDRLVDSGASLWSRMAIGRANPPR
jgi:hypothetical protein